MARRKKINPLLKATKGAFRSKSKLGKAPGAISYVGDKKELPTSISLRCYNADELHVSDITLDELKNCSTSGLTTLVDVVGLSEEKVIADIGNFYDLNTLVLEDLLDTFQRPKIEDHEEYVFSVFKMLYLNSSHEVVMEHVALVLFKHTVVIFQETNDDVFAGVLGRIEKKHGRIRSRGADYLFFALIDAIVDNYYVILEDYRERLVELEEEAYQNPKEATAREIQLMKKEILRIRKWVYPVREIISRLLESEHPLLTKDTKQFLRDTHDHCTEINEDIQLYREMSQNIMDIYMTQMSNKMNEVMKVLTVIASIFIPLTFIAGIYGMNFDNMPELHTQNGYYYLWAVFIIIFLGLLIYFKKKDWL